MSGLTKRAGLAALFMAIAVSARAETPLERGTYLMRSIVACGNCHTPQGPNGPLPGMELAGGLKITDDAFTAYTSNLTPDKETGIGNWSDAELIKAIREGKRPDGSTIGPPMPFGMYRNMADDDVKAIIAYLRSVKPVSNRIEKSSYSFPLPPAYGPPVETITAVAPTDKAYGAYLAGPLGHCMECHSTPGPHGAPDVANALGAGGMQFKGPWGTSISSNLTPHGIGSYSDAALRKVITTGVKPDGSRLKPPMGIAYYANLRPSDLTALIGYLRSLPAK